jgi:hypothetical protein
MVFPEAFETKSVDDNSYVPNANSNDSGQVNLNESNDFANPNDGVRLSVR